MIYRAIVSYGVVIAAGAEAMPEAPGSVINGEF